MARGHIAEVNPDTCAVKVLPYCFVDDFGTVISLARSWSMARRMAASAGAAVPASSSLELKTCGSPFAPSTAGQIARLTRR
jgi:hypothetical protein